MAFTPKDWRDATTYAGGGDTSTPLTAASLEDLETRVTDYADTLVSPSPTASDILFGFADDEDNHQDFYADALATGANSARIGVGYNAPWLPLPSPPSPPTRLTIRSPRWSSTCGRRPRSAPLLGRLRQPLLVSSTPMP